MKAMLLALTFLSIANPVMAEEYRTAPRSELKKLAPGSEDTIHQMAP